VSSEALQSLLDASLAAASHFTRSLEGEVRTARQVEEFINATRNVTLAVVRRNGLPHAAPVIGGCVEGDIYATVSPGSVLAHCLERSSEVAFTAADPVHTLIGAGTADNMGTASEVPELCQRLDRASPFGTFAPQGWDGYVFLLRPRRLFAW
jgi:hypothetical protein